MAADILRRVGWALIVVGLLDIGFMVYCIMNNLSYSSSLNIFAVIAGIFLLRQSMKTASIVSFFAAFMLAGLGLAAGLFPLLMPFDLLATQFRLNPISSILTVVVAVIFLVFAYWVYRSLTSQVVMEARRAAGANAKKPVLAFIVGFALAIGLFGVMAVVTKGPSAENAISKAKALTGPGYKYYVTSMHWSGNSGSATVTAYSSTEIREVKVKW
jgi:hypothetical protein